MQGEIWLFKGMVEFFYWKAAGAGRDVPAKRRDEQILCVYGTHLYVSAELIFR